MITQTAMNRAKYGISKFDINLITRPNIKMVSERSIIVNLDRKRNSLLNSGKYLKQPRAVDVHNAKQNIVIILNNLREKFVASIGVKAESPETLSYALGNTVNDMRNRMTHSYDEVVAFVTGGVHYDGNKNGKESVNLLDSIYRTLVEEEKVPTTVLAEQKIDMLDNAQEGINIYSIRDSANVFGGIITNLKGIKTENSAETEKIAEDLFDFIEISKEVPVKILDDMPLPFNAPKKHN